MNSSQFHAVPADTRTDWESRYRAKHPDIPTAINLSELLPTFEALVRTAKEVGL